jgi:hypothetical protein
MAAGDSPIIHDFDRTRRDVASYISAGAWRYSVCSSVRMYSTTDSLQPSMCVHLP